ncbi:flagellar hook-length control protein FliK [Psychrobacillus insolitus]|uniref:Flagellar hook-length control protein FliK n=1 Tax=Psychrobacillus insolitus TaxID=1461 RepID=A0A2W7MRS1_9BACI|nr:flagellar hook-length control protein FliK [Psychrobacillus insolitus]PZX07864.1 flagellar hook-length control protein FliK [Psychrobacillus insolitus]
MNTATITNTGNIAIQPKGQQQTPMQSKQIFGHVFGQILSNQQVQKPVVQIPDESQQNIIQELLSILGAESLEQVENILGSKELSVNTKELKGLLNKLLDEETDINDELTESNVWDLLAGINEQASQLSNIIVQSLYGQGPATPVEAKQAVQLLKVVQLIGKKSDLTLKQESTLFDISRLVDDLKKMISKEVNTVISTKGKQKLLFETTSQISGVSENFSKPATNHLTLDQSMKQVVIKQVTSPTETVVEVKEVTSNIQGQSSTIVQTKVEAVSVTLLTGKPAQTEELVKELQKAMNRAQFGQAGGANRLVIKLYPEHLGTIRIELIQKDGMLTARMLASTALGKEMLDSQSGQLKQGLMNQNIQVERLEITQALQDTSRQDRNQAFNESFKQQQQQQQKESKQDEKEDLSTFEDFLKEMED